jgi:hypothetical protein
VSEEGQLMTGHPSFCHGCAAINNHSSKLEKMNSNHLAVTTAPMPFLGMYDLFFNTCVSASNFEDAPSSSSAPAAAPAAPMKAGPKAVEVAPDTEVTVWKCEFCGHQNVFFIFYFIFFLFNLVSMLLFVVVY